MNPTAMAAIGPLFQQLFGGQQVAPAAPAPQLGGTTGVGGDALSRLAERNNFGSGIIGGLPEAMQNLPTQQIGAATPSMADMAAENNFGGSEPQKQGGIGQFFGNIDSTLQSPAKTLGIGALGQIDPRLAMAGLLASGFIRQ